MRKWAFFVAAAVAVIGCGGGGGGNNGTGNNGGNGGTAGDSNLSVNLNQNFGTVQFTYLTGQGRAPGDLVAVVRRLEIEDQFGVVRTQLEAPHRLPLANYVIDMLRLNVPFNGQSGRLFESFTLDFVDFLEEGQDGSGNTTYTSLVPPQPTTFPASIRVVPGRDTSLPIFLDDSMFTNNAGTVEFNEDQFRIRNNLNGAGDSIRTFFSDYVAFDLSTLENGTDGDPTNDAPRLSNGELATRVFVSGDNYGIARGTVNDIDEVGTLEVLTLDPVEPIGGTYKLRDANIGGSPLPGTSLPGTYTLRQPNPADLSGLSQITALQGVWRDSSRAMNGFDEFEFILFPTSRTEGPNQTNGNGLRPDEDQEIAIVQRNGNGQIVRFYFGYADLDTGDFNVYPISQLPTAGVDGEITGRLSNYRSANGNNTTSYDLVRRGTFSFTAGAGLPSGFPATGTFVVYRK